MKLIVFVIGLFFLGRAISAAQGKSKQKQIDKVRREFDRQQAEAREWTRKQIELEREQIRQARELEKHEAWLKKHDEEIAKFSFKLAEAERTIAHYKPMWEQAEAEARELDTKVWYFEKRGLPCAGYKDKRDRKMEQAFKLEGKIRKAEFERDQAKRKLEAA